MTEFLEAAFTLPTSIFSVLLILVTLYWVTFFLGIFDLEILDGLFDAFEGVEGVEGVEGALEGAADGALEGVEGVEGEGKGCLSLLGLSGVPMAISGSFLVLFGWLFSYGGMELAAAIPALAALGALAAAGVGVAAFGLALGSTAIAVKPLRKLFEMPPVTGRRDLVGRNCKVSTLRVDEKFGQAEVEGEGATILIQARCRKENTLTRGSRAVVYEYDAGAEVFWVVPMDERLSEAYDIDG